MQKFKESNSSRAVSTYRTISSFGQKDALQYQPLLVETLRSKVVHLATDRCGTIVVQKALDKLPVDQKILLVEDLLCEINADDKRSIDLIDNGNVTFVLRACLKSVVDGHSRMSDFAHRVITALTESNLEALRQKQTDLRYVYKLLVWIFECCSRTEESRKSMSEILNWCSSRADKLANHKYGNIVLQHVIVYGDRQHKIACFSWPSGAKRCACHLRMPCLSWIQMV